MNLIFDLDGTLIDSKEGIVFTLRSVLSENKIEPIAELDHKVVGPPLKELLRIVAGGADDSLAKLEEDFKRVYDADGLFKTTSFPFVDEMLERLSSENILFIATAKRIEPTMKFINIFDWHKYFQDIVGINSFSGNVSKSYLLNALLMKYQLDRKSTVYIGDLESDAIAAADVGVKFIQACWAGVDVLPNCQFFDDPLSLSSELSNQSEGGYCHT